MVCMTALVGLYTEAQRICTKLSDGKGVVHLVLSIQTGHSTDSVIPATVLHDNSHVAPQTRHLHYELSCKLIHILLATSFLNFHYLTPVPLSNFHPLTVSRINLTRTTLPTMTIIICSEYDVWFHNRPDLASLADSCFLRYVTPADTPFSHAQQHCSEFHKLTVQSPVVILFTTRLHRNKFHVPTVYLCVLYGSENKQRLFPYTALTDWFV